MESWRVLEKGAVAPPEAEFLVMRRVNFFRPCFTIPLTSIPPARLHFHTAITTMAPTKRKTSDVDGSQPENKRGRPDLHQPHPNHRQTEEFGIVLRDFYPPEMNNARCQAYTDGTLERPIETLQKACRDTAEKRRSVTPGQAVVHWFKNDLRLHDNRALHMASQRARDHQIPLIGLYILSPEDLTAHLASPARVDFTIRTLSRLQKDLAELDIPLYMETQEKRKGIPGRVVELCQQWEVKHVFGNIEYEVDELRRDAKLVRLCAEHEIDFELAHDSCVVSPGSLSSQQGRQYAVYTPWFRSWLAFLKENPDNLELSEEPGSNPGNARQTLASLFDCQLPSVPPNKSLDEEAKKRLEELYPAGEHESLQRLEKFIEEKGRQYEEKRSMVAGQHTSVLSPYFALGALSARTAVVTAKRANKNHIDRHDSGYISWISEVAWRDFYKHVLAHWPFIW